MKGLVREFCEERDWDQYHNPKDLAIGMVTESSELLDIFRFKSSEDIEAIMADPVRSAHVREELSDVLYFALRFAQMNGIDLYTELVRKIGIDGEKYPVEKMQSAVVGRRKIDSYIMYFTILKKIPLIDLGKSGSVGNEIYVVTNLHQGRDTYNHHSTHRSPDDFYYNGQFYDDRNQRKATLTACDYRFSRITGVGLGNRVQRLTNV